MLADKKTHLCDVDRSAEAVEPLEQWLSVHHRNNEASLRGHLVKSSRWFVLSRRHALLFVRSFAKYVYNYNLEHFPNGEQYWLATLLSEAGDLENQQETTIENHCFVELVSVFVNYLFTVVSNTLS